ncbi:MAG: hypothetical protein ACKOEO_10125 [Planctomycetaceae bacterium]
MRSCVGGLLTILLMFWATPAIAQPKIGLRLELISTRSRPSAPLPLLGRLEYNQPQYLEGTLELEVYNAKEYISEADLIAKIRREGIVLAGADYQFKLLFPPLPAAKEMNYAVRAWFVTEDDRIPLTSMQGRLNPPEPFDLLMLPDAQRERGRLVGSVCENERLDRPSTQDREWLQQLLTFETWAVDTVAESSVAGSVSAGQGLNEFAGPESEVAAPKSVLNPLQGLGHFVHSWNAGDVPEDPLWLCAFDLLLLSDGGLGKLNPDQLSAVLTWVRAGGSICIHAPEQLTGEHLNFLRELLGFGRGRAGDLSLDSEGRLLVVADNPDALIEAEAELGRAVLLPSAESLVQLRVTSEQQGRLLGLLWRFRKDLQLTDPESFRKAALLNRLRGVEGLGSFELDDYGVRVEGPVRSELIRDVYGQYNRIQLNTMPGPNGGTYVVDSSLAMLLTTHGLQPQTDAYSATVSRYLLPSTLRLVPTWIMFLILVSYVTVIGPVEYFVLGWLRARKYTWVVFPATTLAFTLLTMAVAQIYMGDQDSQRTIRITDLGESRQPLRQSAITTLFYGSQATLPIAQRLQFAAHMSDDAPVNPYDYGYNSRPRTADVPPEYHGNFPQNWTLQQQVRQWSPVSLRTLTLSPETENLRIPDLPWEDVELVSTEAGQEKLRWRLRELESETGDRYYAAAFNSGKVYGLHGMPTMVNFSSDQYPYNNPRLMDEETRLHQVLQTLPTQRPRANASERSGFFQLFSGISPDGSGTLEDLVMSDGSDESEWVLLVARRSGQEPYQDVEVFRCRYRR